MNKKKVISNILEGIGYAFFAFILILGMLEITKFFCEGFYNRMDFH